MESLLLHGYTVLIIPLAAYRNPDKNNSNKSFDKAIASTNFK